MRFRTAVVFFKVDDMTESRISSSIPLNIVYSIFINEFKTLFSHIKFSKMRSLSRIKVRKHEKYVLLLDKGALAIYP